MGHSRGWSGGAWCVVCSALLLLRVCWSVREFTAWNHRTQSDISYRNLAGTKRRKRRKQVFFCSLAPGLELRGRTLEWTLAPPKREPTPAQNELRQPTSQHVRERARHRVRARLQCDRQLPRSFLERLYNSLLESDVWLLLIIIVVVVLVVLFVLFLVVIWVAIWTPRALLAPR